MLFSPVFMDDGSYPENTEELYLVSVDVVTNYELEIVVILGDQSASSYTLEKQINSGSWVSQSITNRESSVITVKLSEITKIRHSYIKNGSASEVRELRIGNLFDNGFVETDISTWLGATFDGAENYSLGGSSRRTSLGTVLELPVYDGVVVNGKSYQMGYASKVVTGSASGIARLWDGSTTALQFNDGQTTSWSKKSVNTNASAAISSGARLVFPANLDSRFDAVYLFENYASYGNIPSSGWTAVDPDTELSAGTVTITNNVFEITVTDTGLVSGESGNVQGFFILTEENFPTDGSTQTLELIVKSSRAGVKWSLAAESASGRSMNSVFQVLGTSYQTFTQTHSITSGTSHDFGILFSEVQVGDVITIRQANYNP